MYKLDLLTNDSKYLLGKFYEEYVKKRNKKVPKNQASFFDNPEYIHQTFMPEWLLEDLVTTCFELQKNGFIEGLNVDDSLVNIHLTFEGIAVMETSFSDKLDEVLEWMTKIKSAVPFV